MSQENIELFERADAAMNPGEFSDELAAEFLTPGYRIENVSTALSDKTYYGVDGVREWIADTFEGLDANSRYETVEIIADGDDFVVARVRLVGHGANSGAPVTLRWMTVAWYEGGKMTRGVGYVHRREALEAVGLAD
jgi:ketosteroid isomerase-like protein